MRDPHVVNLTYSLITDTTVTYLNPPAREFDTPIAHFELRDGTLTVSMKLHYPTAAGARAAVEVVLANWVLKTAIKCGKGRLDFRYERAKVIDRSPPEPGEPQTVLLEGMSMALVSGHVGVHLSTARYPDPPTDFERTPDVEALSTRWLDCRAGKEPLLSCAYFVASYLKEKFHGYGSASEKLAISKNVIDKLHAIASNHGDERTARKMASHLKPLTAAHAAWIEQLVPEIILRLGQLPIVVPTDLLTMDKLPTLQSTQT
jgi:hypothetical protein